jgi:hypothetical protein
MEKKRLNITIDVKGEAGEYLHKAVQNVLFSKGFGWAHNGAAVKNYGDTPLYIEMDTDGTEKKIWQLCRDGIKVKATDILSGAFDLDKWIKDNTTKKDVIYCVDLTWVKGEAREVLSAAIQKKAFEKGYKWGGVETTIQLTGKPGLFFWTSDKTICCSDDFVGAVKCITNYPFVEISVNKALRGEYRSVK